MTTCHLTKSELRRFFEVFDEDNSGGISPDELCEAFRSLGWDDVNPTHCAHMIKEQFGPNVEEISFNQFRELVDDVQIPTDSESECRKAFSFFDKSGIGKICVADLKEAGRVATGAVVPDSLIRQIMNAVDTNKDGYIQFSEFHKAVAKVGIREDESSIFEKENGLGVGFGSSFRSADLGTTAEQARLLALLSEKSGAYSMADFGDYEDGARHPLLRDDSDDEEDPDYNPDEGVSLAQTAFSASTTSGRLGGSKSAAFASKSMTFNGRTVRTRNYQSRYWDVKAHITPSQRADMRALEGSEEATRFRIEGMAEAEFNDDIMAPFVDALVAEEERVEALRVETQRAKELEAAARAGEKAAAAAAKAEAIAAAAAAKAEALEKRKQERAEKLNVSRGIGGAGAPFGYGPKPVATKPPSATPLVKPSASTTSGAALPSASPSLASTTTTVTPNNNATTQQAVALKKKDSSSAPPPPSALKGSASTKSSTSASGAKTGARIAVGSQRSPPTTTTSGAAVSFEADKQQQQQQQKRSDGERTTIIICKQPTVFWNGLISKSEVRKMMVHFYEDVTDEDFEYLFSEGDKDGDGYLSVKDYRDFLELIGFMDF